MDCVTRAGRTPSSPRSTNFEGPPAQTETVTSIYSNPSAFLLWWTSAGPKGAGSYTGLQTLIQPQWEK